MILWSRDIYCRCNDARGGLLGYLKLYVSIQSAPNIMVFVLSPYLAWFPGYPGGGEGLNSGREEESTPLSEIKEVIEMSECSIPTNLKHFIDTFSKKKWCENFLSACCSFHNKKSSL